jgi:uncharacterized protein YkwD
MSYRRLPIIVLVVAVLVSGTAAPADAGAVSRRNKMLHLLNGVRRHHGLPTFRINRELSTKALRHSRRMAEANTLFHTRDLFRVVRSYHPSCWGENVGRAAYMKSVLRLWMRSSGHRANILRRAFRRVGIGVVGARGSAWVTVIFYGR